MHLLYRRLFECKEHRVHAGLITRPLRREPLENICVDAQRNWRLRRDGFPTTPHYTAPDVFDIGLRMLGTELDVLTGFSEAAMPRPH